MKVIQAIWKRDALSKYYLTSCPCGVDVKSAADHWTIYGPGVGDAEECLPSKIGKTSYRYM